MSRQVTVAVDGKSVSVPPGSTAAAAIAAAGLSQFRTSVDGRPRGPLCGMGICFECRVTINGRAHRRSCQTVCTAGMEISTDGP